MIFKNISRLPASPSKMTRNSLSLKENTGLTNFQNAFTNSDCTVAMSSPGKMKPERNTDLRILSFVDSRMSEISRTSVIII
jgi:hypothetical protein